MKKKCTLLMLAACTVISSRAQMLFQEDFTSPFNPAGWSLQNLSAPTATPGLSWFQGNGAVFPAFNGGANDYVGANFNSTSDSISGQTLSNWLITPTLNLMNGAVFQFATRTSTNPSSFPDRLEVYMSTAGAGANVGTSATSVGTFSTLLVSVNPALSTTGYPGTWTVYSTTLSGLASPTVGRVGFRYYVTNGGFGGTNSDYIGLDAVRYFNPCGASVQSYTVCAGQSATLAASGAMSGSSYTWTPSASNASAIVVSPGSTTSYTLTYTEPTGTCAAVISTVTIGNQLSMNISASAGTVCAGSTVTLTASSAATSYSWSTGSTAASTTVAPTNSTTYSVGGVSGLCFGGATINITALPNPTIASVLVPTVVCQGASFTLTATGANNYVWLNSPSTGFTTNPLPLTAGAAGPRSYTLIGIGTNGCASAMLMNFTVNPTPTVTASAGNTIVCTNNTVILTGGGASTYAWSGAATSTSNPFTFTAGTTAGVQNFTITGTTPEGCSSTASVAVTVSVCNTNPVNVSEAGFISETLIYPNPFSSQITLSQLEGNVEVFNALGEVVLRSDVNGSISLKTTELTRGVYVVKAYNTSGELVKTIKLLKN
jgi:hypothetical protein